MRPHQRQAPPANRTRCASRSSASATGASSFVQGVVLPRRRRAERSRAMHVNLGGSTSATSSSAPPSTSTPRSRPRLGEAIWAGENNNDRFRGGCPSHLGVPSPRMTHTGWQYLSQRITSARPKPPTSWASLRTRYDVVVSYLTGGFEQATMVRRADPRCRPALRATASPVFIRARTYWTSASRGGPADHSATTSSRSRADIEHRSLARLFLRARRLADEHPSSHVAATWTSFNMLERGRLSPRDLEPTRSASIIRAPRGEQVPPPAEDVHVGPSDYVPWLTGPQVGSTIRLEGRAFGDVRSTSSSARGLGLAQLAGS